MSTQSDRQMMDLAIPYDSGKSCQIQGLVLRVSGFESQGIDLELILCKY